jgi:hypothetical protein
MPRDDDTFVLNQERPSSGPDVVDGKYIGRHGRPTLRERVGCLPLLAAVLVTAVLLVGVVSALKPSRGGALGLFPPDPSVTATDDDDPYAQTDDPEATGSPSPGASKRPTKKPSPKPLPTTPVGLPPTGGASAPGSPTGSSPSPSKSASPSPSMAPVTVEGESAAMAGGAKARSVSAASAGKVAGFLGNGGTVTFNLVAVPAAGTYPLRIFYISGTQRNTVVQVNNGTPVTMTFPVTKDWFTVGSVTIQVFLKAGANTIQFGNPSDWASDIDKVTVGG